MEIVKRMLAFRPIALMLALLALSSCAYAPDNSVFSGGRCGADSAKHLQGVDWQEATKLNLRIRQDDFLPVYMGLLQHRPYVLAIENADDTSHTFRAMEFFRAVAVAGVRVDGGEFNAAPCLKGVSIPAGKVTEIRLVAIRDGSYEFDDNSLMFSLAMVGSAGGFITIEPPRVLLESPLDHLKLFEKKPVEAMPPPEQGGLFDDQQEAPAPEPGGLFDDQEEAPSQPSGGLFDDPAPEQPINGSPSVPVETVPDPGENLFGEPSLAPPEEQPEAPAPADPDEGLFGEPSLAPPTQQPEAPIVDAPAPADPAEGLFNEPSLVNEPSLAPPAEQPEAPLVDVPLEELFVEEPLEAPVVDVTPEPSPEFADPAPFDSETDMMMEEAPIVEDAPEIPETEVDDEAEEMFVEEAPAAPVALPADGEHLGGPPADIFSDPPDVVNSGSGSGGAAGDDQFGGSG